MVTSPPSSWGPKRGQNCDVSPAFSGVSKRGEIIRISCLNPTFAEAQKKAELLRNPCILSWPQCQARGENQNWVCHPYLLKGPKKERNCYATATFSGVPYSQRGKKITSGYLARRCSEAQKRAELLRIPCILMGPTPSMGRKSEVVTSPVPSHGSPKEGRIATPAFLGVPNAKRGEKIGSGYLTTRFSRA